MALSRRGVLGFATSLWTGAGNGATILAQASTPTPASALQTAPSKTPVRLSYNENPFGPSPAAREAVRALGDGAWKYSYDEVPALRSLLATRAGLKPENVFVAEGSGEILKLVALLYAEPGRRVVATHPTFPMLPQYAGGRGAAVTWVNVDRTFGHDFAALISAIKEDTSLVYLCNPNNPTGALADPTALRSFIRAVPPRVLTVVDEAYIDFVPDPDSTTLLGQVEPGRNLLITRSFSKIYGLAGLRVGYGIANANLIRRLDAARLSIPNQAGIAAARASFGDMQFCSETRTRINASKAYAARLFEELGLRYLPSHANFIMFDVRTESLEFIGFARRRGVMVAEVADPFSTWVRVSMGRPEDMQAFGSVLRAFVHKAAS